MDKEIALALIEAELMKGAREYFEKNEFIEVIVPNITRATGACENIATMFELDYFGQRAFLAQTKQLYLESLVPKLKKVWHIGPSFRAENEVDNRHLTEFPLIEIEFAGDFKELIKHIEGTIVNMINRVKRNRKEELSLFVSNIKHLNIKAPFKQITYHKAIDLLGLNFGDDLKSIHEKKICEIYGNKPIFITHFPVEIKFFNMRNNDKDPSVVNSADLILPKSGEAVGAAEREYEYERVYKKLKNSRMLKQLEEKGKGIEDFKWYLERLRKEGNVLHAGCGIGFNRVTQFVILSDDIRQSTLFPLNREMLR